MTRFHIAACCAALLFAAAPARAQETTGTTTTAPTATSAATTDVIAVPVWPKAALALPDQAVATTFSLGEVEGIEPQLVAGVTAKGYARKVAVEDQTIGQVLVTTVAKGEKEETISTEGLTAQFDAAATSELFPDKTVEVTGSKTALIAALKRLAESGEDEDDTKSETDSVTENQTSTGSSSNDEASSYQTPTVTSTSSEDDDEEVTEVRTSTEGCSVRIDTSQEKAVVQSKEQTYVDGVLTSEGSCSDSEVSYVLKKSYSSCSADVVDLEAMTASPQFAWYYTDESGENHTVSDCAQDEDTVYAITEDESVCSISLDFVNALAVPQSALTYVNRNGTTVQARGCDTSTLSEAIAMTESTSACSLRHDYTAGLSYELSMWTYVRNGVTYQAAPCADSGRTFAHVKVYTDSANAYVCTPITNLDAKTVTLQYRLQITIDGASQYIGECTPDTTSSAILSTTDGCTDPSAWTHDLDAGVSYGQERFYYTNAAGSRVYVTSCQTSSVSYTHDVVVTGYQYHDDQLWAYPLSTVTITANGAVYTIASSEVLAGAPQIPYVLLETSDELTGESTYDGCEAYRGTATYEHWQRPDETVYLKQIGEGTPQGPVDVCSTSIVKDADYLIGYYAFSYYASTLGVTCSSDRGGTMACSTWGNVYLHLQKTAVKNTETGDTTYSCASLGQSSVTVGTGNWGSVPSSPYPHYDDEWGWDYKVISTGYVGPSPTWPSVPPCPSDF